jgi:hypothetical protein
MISNLSKNSILFISLLEKFIKNNCALKGEKQSIKVTKNTKHVLSNIYEEIEEGEKYVKNIVFPELVKVVNPIYSINEIPKPKTFSANSFPASIVEHINAKSCYCVTYNFSLKTDIQKSFIERKIKVIFITEEKTTSFVKYDNYIERVILLLFLISKNSQNKCAKNMTIYIYLTSKQKILPPSNLYILNQNNVNSAFTYSCPYDSEVVVFRKEEWFKTLTHELFHSMGMDFSLIHDSNNTCNNLLKIFPIPIKEVNISESYTECWARIINIFFCSYYGMKKQKSVYTFLYNFEILIQMEKMYSCFQMVKVLDFMGLKYKDLYSSVLQSKIVRENLYKEKTDVFCYYVLTFILLENYQEFLFFCKHTNNNLFQFNGDEAHSKKNIEKFCELIKDNYKKNPLLIKCMENFIYENKKNVKYKDINYLLNNTRMTLCEIK